MPKSANSMDFYPNIIFNFGFKTAARLRGSPAKMRWVYFPRTSALYFAPGSSPPTLAAPADRLPWLRLGGLPVATPTPATNSRDRWGRPLPSEKNSADPVKSPSPDRRASRIPSAHRDRGGRTSAHSDSSVSLPRGCGAGYWRFQISVSELAGRWILGPLDHSFCILDGALNVRVAQLVVGEVHNLGQRIRINFSATLYSTMASSCRSCFVSSAAR